MPEQDLVEVGFVDLADRLAMSLLLNGKLIQAIARKRLPGEADTDRKLLAQQIVEDLKRGGVEKVLRRPLNSHAAPAAWQPKCHPERRANRVSDSCQCFCVFLHRSAPNCTERRAAIAPTR